MDHQHIIDICLIPGKALVGDNSDNRAAWAMLCAIALHMTGFREHHSLPSPASFFWLSRDDLVRLFAYRRSAFAHMEDLLKISIKDHRELAKMCRTNPAIAAATAYHSMNYFLPRIPQRDEIRDSWACFKRMLSPFYLTNRWYDGPAQWTVNYLAGWSLANKLLDRDKNAVEPEVIEFQKAKRKSR